MRPEHTVVLETELLQGRAQPRSEADEGLLAGETEDDFLDCTTDHIMLTTLDGDLDLDSGVREDRRCQ